MKVCEIPPSEIHVTSTVIGKGAFGEVKVAQWRGMDVAHKMLHHGALAEDVDSLQHEVEILSQLRHPNLVLFLGISIAISEAGSSTAIVTELLSCSLYDILEVKRISLTLPDILDLSIDIANGLNYLHSHSPAIVHRDISAKNILIAGNRAKIADLGQAKLFAQSTLSRQTGMPGAMAYSAPEVLTGKYSAKIDIFSFGILTAQMITGEYPRVDRREDQFQKANQYECLRLLLSKCVDYNPDLRPTAGEICEQLTELRDNDRYYPISRRTSSEKDVGIEALAWMREKVSSTTGELSLKLDQTSKQLRAEEERLRAQAAIVDSLQAQLQQQQAEFADAQQRISQLEGENSSLRGKLTSSTNQSSELRDQMKLLSSELSRSTSRYQALEGKYALKDMECKELMEECGASRSEERQLTAQLEHTGDQVEQLMRRIDVLNRQLHVQVDYGKDLEARLEQALSRWRQEKEQFTADSQKLTKLTRQYAAVLDKCEHMKKEKENADGRLKQYEGLPLPEEIKARLADLDNDNQMLQANLMQLDMQREVLQDDKQNLEIALANSSRTVQDQQQALETAEHKTQSLHLQVDELTETNKQQMVSMQKLEKQCAESKAELDIAYKEIDKCRDRIDKLSMELSEERLKVAAGGQEQAITQGTLTDEAAPARRGSVMSSSSAAMDMTQLSTDFTPPTERISDIAVKHQVERAMGRDGAAGLLQLIQASVDDERTIWRCLRALRELVLHDENSRQQCWNSEPELWVMPLMTRFLHVGILQAQAARLLGTLSFGNDVFRRRAGENRAMQCLSEALHVHFSDETLTLNAFTAVTNLAHGSYENRCRFFECGGIDTLIQTMGVHVALPKLQCQGCWALLTLAGSDEVAEGVVKAQGDRAVIQALLTHAMDAGVQQYGCWALRNLALASEALAQSLKAQGAMELCRMAIERFCSNAEVQQQARNTLAVFMTLSNTPLPSAPTAGNTTLPRVKGATTRSPARGRS